MELEREKPVDSLISDYSEKEALSEAENFSLIIHRKATLNDPIKT